MKLVVFVHWSLTYPFSRHSKYTPKSLRCSGACVIKKKLWTFYCRCLAKIMHMVCVLLCTGSVEGGMGVKGIHPDVNPSFHSSVHPSIRLSVHPSVDKVSGTFWKTYLANSLHTWDLHLWDESLDPFSFLCLYPQCWPSGGQIFGWKWGFLSWNKANLRDLIAATGLVI